VEITGRVPSVVDHLREAAVVVVPLRVGGGTRIKIYEAMAVGKAVVSTSVGAEGLDVHHGKDIFLSDTAADFAGSVAALLRDAEKCNRIARAASELAANYAWPLIGTKFAQILDRVIGESFKAVTRDAKASEDLTSTSRSW
jgi:glycosyltransferase involved in cell wall biosynthesis